MGIKIYTIQGFRDYRMVSLEDIIEDLEEEFQHVMRFFRALHLSKKRSKGEL